MESIKFEIEESIFNDFYFNKTKNRIDLFISQNNSDYMDSGYQINGKIYPSFSSLFQKIDFTKFYDSNGYEKFHGDLQFDNILFDNDTDKFTYIDWRDSFSQITNGGDINYDLAKLYGGILISYLDAKKESAIEFNEGNHSVNFKLPSTKELSSVKLYFEKKIIHEGYDIDKIKLLTSIIFINMSPLHEMKFSKALWFKSIELMDECFKSKIY
jgi:thiamine kinase-like enzyme